MNLANKFVYHCVVISVVIVGSAVFSVEARNPQRQGGLASACMVKYLRMKKKLSADFRPALPTTLQCRLVTPLVIEYLREAVHDSIEKKFPHAADCLTDEFYKKQDIDHVIKITVLDTMNSRLLSEPERQIQLAATRSLLKEDLEDIAGKCHTDDKNLINLFVDELGIQNKSLAVLQYEYCLAKYARDNNLLEFGNVEINPQHIDPDSVDCDQIVATDKRNVEKDLIDGASDTFKGERSRRCVVNLFRSGKMYDWEVACKVARKLDFLRATKEAKINRLFDKIGEFVSSIIVCLFVE